MTGLWLMYISVFSLFTFFSSWLLVFFFGKLQARFFVVSELEKFQQDPGPFHVRALSTNPTDGAANNENGRKKEMWNCVKKKQRTTMERRVR